MVIKLSDFKGHTFEPVILENVENQPRRFETKRELKDYCKKNKIVSGALEDVRGKNSSQKEANRKEASSRAFRKRVERTLRSGPIHSR